jgi:hypothetical protein
MGFPDDPLKIVTELEIDGMWQDISADVYDRDPVTITRGKANEGAAVDPGSCRLTLNNGISKLTGVVGRYSPRNPRSDLYGKFGRNTPLRVSVLEGGVFLDNLSGEPDLTTTPDVPALDITGDLDIRWEGEADWYASGAQMLIGKWGAAGNRSYHMRIENRSLYLHTTQDGTVGRTAWIGIPENLPKRIALRATFDADNGSGGVTFTFYWADSLDGPWRMIGVPAVSTDGTLTIFNSSAPLSVAPQQLDSGISVLRYPFTGRCYRAEVRSAINGTVVASPNFEAQTEGTVAFTDSAGRAWSVGTVTEDFEDATYNVTITNGGNLPWARSGAHYDTGAWSLRSGAITNNQTSDAVVTVPPMATELKFSYWTSSENSGSGFEGDRLLVLVDGVQVLRAQGTTPWSQTTVDVAGKSTVTFRYVKDNSTAFGEDAAHIDNLVFFTGGAAITNRRSRFVGEVSEWPTRWEAEGTDGYVPLVASGILRRLSQGKKALNSTLRRRITSFKPLSYWPMEEGADATSAVNLGVGNGPLKLDLATWASANTLASSDPLPVLASQSGVLPMMYGPIPAPATAPTSWTVQWVYRHDTIHTTIWTHMRIISTGTVGEWLLQWGQGTARVIARDTFGTELQRWDTAIGTDLWGRWTKVQFEVSPDPTVSGQLDWQLIWTDVGGDSGAASGNYVGTVGRPVAVASPAGGFAAELDGMAIGHISAWAAWDANSNGAYLRAIDAWTGETAGDRMLRLSGEESLPLIIADGTTDHAQVGPQVSDTVLNIVQDAANADGGNLYENREDIGLVYRGRRSFYNQPVGLALDFNARGLITPIEPVDDDQLIRNDRTIERQNGGSAQAVLATGRLSVQNPPLGVGTYDDSTTLNLFTDDQVVNTAFWYLRMGTVDEARYPSVAVDLTRNAALISDAADLEVGDRLTIANPPEWLPPGLIDQRVEGYQETLSLAQWIIDYNCAPHSVWNVAETDGREAGIANGASLGKVDSISTVLGEALDPTETAVDVLVTPGKPWVEAAPIATPNPYLDTDALGWNASGGTMARVPAPDSPLYSGWALQFTPNGVASSPNAFTTKVPAITGNQYVISGWMRCATSRTIGLNLNWYTGNAYTSTSSNTLSVVANTWKYFEATFTAPAGIDGMSIAASIGGTPPVTDVILVQGANIRPVLGGAPKPRSFPFSVSAGGEDMRVTAVKSFTDSFTGRTVANGWGVADYGDTWTTNGGTAANYSVASGAGVHAHTSINVSRYTLLPAPSADVDLTVTVSSSALATGGPEYLGPVARWTDANNMYFARLAFNTDQTLTLVLQKRVGGTQTDLTSVTVPGTHAVGAKFKVRFSVAGSTLSAKAWLATAREPEAWQATATDTAITAVGSVGVRSILSSLSTNTLPVNVSFDDFTVANYQRFTVVRSTNAVSKSHSAGENIGLTRPGVVAL